MKNALKKRRTGILIGISIVLLITIAVIFCLYRDHVFQKKSILETFSTSDKEVADMYSNFYEVPAEEVAELQDKNHDWEQTQKALETAYFTISENVKYQMYQDGYSLEDMETAETLSVQTGRKAIDLIQAKGKTSDHRQWSEVVKEDEILSSEEQLGLSKDEVTQLKERKLTHSERIDVAIFILNKKYTFREILNALDNGKKVQEL